MTVKEKPHKYQEIYADLRQLIRSGSYGRGQRLPSEAELTVRYKASRVTVARALRDLQTQGVIERRVGSGSYVLEVEHSELRFGLLIPDLGRTEIFEPICQGMSQAGRSSQYALVWGNGIPGSDEPLQAEQLCQYYVSKRVSGVFFAPLELTPAKDEVNRRIVQSLDNANIPVVLLDRDIDAYPRRSRYDVVGIDNRRAGYTITEHLVQLGCERVVFVGRSNSASTVDARIAGYREALFSYERQFSLEFVQRIDPCDSSVVEQMLRMVRPEACVCANDLTAAHLMRTLATLGSRVPQDIRVAGFDDVKYASLLPVSLTTVRQPCLEIGAAAVAAMLERVVHPETPARDILLDFRLVVRDSCGSKLNATSQEQSTSSPVSPRRKREAALESRQLA